MKFPDNPEVPNAFGVSRNQARADLLPLLKDLAKFANNIGLEFAGPSSNPIHQRNIDQILAVFERFNITGPRIEVVLAAA